MRQAQQADELSSLATRLQQMLSVHQQEFPPATPPIAPPPEAVDAASREKQAVQGSRIGVSFLKRSARREAAEHARVQAREEAAAEVARREQERQRVQQELDASWQRLLSNDPDAVIATLEAAFADNAAPAVPVDCTDGRVTVLMVMDPEEAFPDRVPKLTPTGKPSARKLSKTERSELYVAWMSSNILATVREALATAPSIEAVTIAVLRKGTITPFGEIPLAVVYAGTLTREMCDRIVWERPESLDAISYAEDLLMNTKGRTKQLIELDLTERPDLQAVVDEVRQAFQDSPESRQPVSVSYDVMLLAPGTHQIHAIKVVRELTRLGLKESKDLVDRTPTVVLAGIDQASAERARDALLKVGAGIQVELTPSG
jgi:ribosomal protein L7/L12